MLLGVGIVERETLMLAIGTDELLLYTKGSLEQGEILEKLCGISPVHSEQYQQGNDTTFRQQKHPGIGFFFASRSEIVFRAAFRPPFADRSVLAISRLKRIRWTFNMS